MNKPVAWMLKTGHGTKILEVKPYCEVDYWIPLYTYQHERPHNTVLVPCDKLAEMQAEIEALKCGLESMVDEFRQLDLPYGSKAYTKATELLRRKNECD